MRLLRLHFATYDEYFAGAAEWDTDCLQLSPGPLDFHSTLVDLPGVRLEWNRVGARIRVREVFHGPRLAFGFLPDSASAVVFHGQELDPESVLHWHHGEEQEYVAGTGVALLLVFVDPALAEMLGWVVAPEACRRVPRQRIDKLVGNCRIATHAAQRLTAIDGNASMQKEELRLRDRILADLELAAAPWLDPQETSAENAILGTRSFQLVKEVEHSFRQHDFAETLRMNSVAEKLGVSRRTLFHAFRNCLDMGPQGYLRLIRLHWLRDRLLEASPTTTSVTALANTLGFDHMGRLSTLYKQHFRELPSETLKRR